MAWFNTLTYKPVQTSGSGSLGGVGGGWTDVGTQWKLANLGGGTTDGALQTTYSGSSPWDVAQLVRKAANESTQNVRLCARYQSNSTGSSAIANAPWVIARYVAANGDATENSIIVRTGSFWTIASGATSGSQANGSVSNYVGGSWYDLEVTIVTSGATTTIIEQTWTVADHINSAFASGGLITPAAGNTYTTSTYNTISGGTGLFFYEPGSAGNIVFFSSDTDIAATALTLTPASASGPVGSPITLTVGVNGAQNGGAVTFADGGAAGTFSPATITLGGGVGATQTVTYTPATSGSITVKASSSALTGAAISATASVTATTGPATALRVSPASQAAVAGTATGNYTAGTNGTLASSTAISLSDGGAGGVFSPASLTFASGVGSTGTFTYTPSSSAATGSISLTTSASGLTSATANVSVTAQATALSISPSSQNVSAGTASGNYTVSLASGGLPAAVTVALSDGGAGGTFAPVTVALAAGTSSSSTFTYTPAIGATGTKTIMASTSGLTSAISSAVVSAATILLPTSSSVVASPFTWVTGLANTTTSDNSAVRTWNTGAYLRVYVSGTTSLNIVFGASSTSANFIVQIDSQLPSAPIACLNNGSYTVTLPDTGVHSVNVALYSISQIAGRWAGTLAVTINGFQLGSGGTGAPAKRGSRNLLIYGDSITEGTESHDGADGLTTSYAYLIGESYRRQGWEYSIKGAGYSGYTVAVPSANGGQPPAWTAGSDSNSSWNKIDGSGATGAALTTGTIGGATERFIIYPDLIIDVWGTNDGLQSVAAATVQSTVMGLFQRWRVAAPNAIIVKIIPFGGYERSGIQAAAAAVSDPKLIVVDLQTDACMTQTGYCGNLLTGASSGQAVHPWSLGSANLAVLVLRQIDAAYLPFSTARSFGSAS